MQLLVPALPAQSGAQPLAGGVEGLLAASGAMGEAGAEKAAPGDPAPAFAQALAGVMMTQPQASSVAAAPKAGGEEVSPSAAQAPGLAVPQPVLAHDGEAAQTKAAEAAERPGQQGPQGADIAQAAPAPRAKPAAEIPSLPGAEPPAAMAETLAPSPATGDRPLAAAPQVGPNPVHQPHAERTGAPRGETRGPAKAESKTGVAPSPDAQAEAAPSTARTAVAATTDPSANLGPDDGADPDPGAPADRPVKAAEAPLQAFTAETATAPAAADAPKAGAVQTVAHLAAQIVRKVESRATRFDVQLDPAGLGKVDVRIEIGARGEISAALSFDNPQAAAELRGRAGELQRALEQAGFDVSRGGLSFDLGGQGSGQGLWEQQAGHAPVWRGRAFVEAAEVPDEPLPARRSAAASRIDVMV